MPSPRPPATAQGHQVVGHGLLEQRWQLALDQDPEGKGSRLQRGRGDTLRCRAPLPPGKGPQLGSLRGATQALHPAHHPPNTVPLTTASGQGQGAHSLCGWDLWAGRPWVSVSNSTPVTLLILTEPYAVCLMCPLYR